MSSEGSVSPSGSPLGVTVDPGAERRTAEALAQQRRLYEAILTNTPDLAYVFDLQHRFIYVNDGLLKMWGRTWDDAIGKTCLELGYEPWHAALHDREIEQVVATRQPIRGEVPFHGTFGRRIYDYIFVPVLGPTGEVEAVAGTTRDVTERKEAERRKDEFLATLGHELRNPLAPIRMGLELLKLIGDDPVQREETRSMMERQTQQMVRLIDDLLDMSRITQGKLQLRTCRVELAHVLQNAVEAARPFIAEAGHELTVSIPAEPIHLDADPSRLAQVVSNLLNNSTKYTPGGGRIRLAAERRGNEVVIAVQDNGLGIPAHMQTGIFEMFCQIDRPLERGYQGLGIGLTLVKQLVEMHGGSVVVASDGEGRGSEFLVRLPLPPAPPRPPQTLTAEPERQTARLRILVVDDNEGAARVLGMVVKMLGNDVRTVYDGTEAVTTAAEFLPHVVLMDLGMPRMNGFEAARRIREQPWGRRMVLVALTGWGQEEDRERSQAAGFDHYLVKPAEPATLQKLLAELGPLPG